LPDALKGVQSSLELNKKQRRRTVWRMDGGGGSDANFRLLLQQGYQLHAKGFSSSRAAALAKKVSRWDAYADIWLGEVDPTFDLGRPIRVFIQRRRKKEQFLHNYFVSTLKLPSKINSVRIRSHFQKGSISQALGEASRRLAKPTSR
jgi:hypothetical protein